MYIDKQNEAKNAQLDKVHFDYINNINMIQLNNIWKDDKCIQVYLKLKIM